MEKRIVLDERMESYSTFFDHAWSKTIYALASGTAFEEPVFDLARAWKAAANTHVLPWLMADQLKQFYAGVMRTDEPFAIKLVNALLIRLEQRSGGAIPDEIIELLRTLLKETAIEFGLNRQKIAGAFDPQTAWREFLSLSEFQFSLWGSQRLAYGALYYAYEDFLLRVFTLATGRSNYEIRSKQFGKDFAQLFGTGLRDACWSDPQVHIARLTRHALVHNGGRLTERLRNLKHGLRITSGEIQIMAPDTRALFDLLKVRALRLTEHVVGLTSTAAVAS